MWLTNYYCTDKEFFNTDCLKALNIFSFLYPLRKTFFRFDYCKLFFFLKKLIFLHQFRVRSSISSERLDQSKWSLLHLVRHVLSLVQLQNSFVFVFLTIFLHKIQFLCMTIDYLGFDWFGSFSGSPSIDPVWTISPICLLLITVIAKNLLFTNLIYVCLVIALQLLEWYRDDSKTAAWTCVLKLCFPI